MPVPPTTREIKPMADPFASVAPSIDGPFVNLYQVTPSDEAPLPLAARRILGGTMVGDVIRVTTVGMAPAEYVDAPVSILAEHNIRVVKVWATGTCNGPIWALV